MNFYLVLSVGIGIGSFLGFCICSLFACKSFDKGYSQGVEDTLKQTWL